MDIRQNHLASFIPLIPVPAGLGQRYLKAQEALKTPWLFGLCSIWFKMSIEVPVSVYLFGCIPSCMD